MEKVNIAELLRDCPKGMELDCVMCNNPIELEGVVGDDAGYPIKAVGKDGFHHVFTSYGASYNRDDAKCVIFPKGKTTWKGFQRPFKDGDIVITTLGNTAIIKEPAAIEYFAHCVLIGAHLHTVPVIVCVARLATEEEKQEIFQIIKDKGYKWNEKTKTLENRTMVEIQSKIRNK